eukprot:scaffold4949_cov59-Attheya_sp.AAC.1
MSSDSMLAAMACFISDRILAMRLLSTNMLCSGANLFPSLSKTPLWILSGIAATNVVVFGQGRSSASYGFPIGGARVAAEGLSGRDEEEFAYGDERNSCGDVRVMFGVMECSGHVIIEY